VLDGVLVLGIACLWTNNLDFLACFVRAKKGFIRLFGDDHAKSVEATFQLVIQTTRGDELIAELRAI